jgi:hypothetical protein
MRRLKDYRCVVLCQPADIGGAGGRVVVLSRSLCPFSIQHQRNVRFSTASAEGSVQNTLHLVELTRVQGVGHLDMGVAFPIDRDD